MAIKTVCVTKCFSGGNLYNEGDLRVFRDDEKIPPHFQAEEVHEKEVKESEEEKEKNIAELQAELDINDIAYDKRWGKAKLESALAVAKKDANFKSKKEA